MSSDGDTTDYSTWTPEELMRDYHGEVKRELLLRCMEWYTNSEVEAKINKNRTDGSKIKNPNFYAEIKRNIENIALRDGHLPVEYRLQFDMRRLANLEARLGSKNARVQQIRSSVNAREAVKVHVLRDVPTLQELEAARPDNGHQVQKGRDSKDYWYKFLAATERYTETEMQLAYNMGAGTIRDEVKKAKRIVRRFDEIDEIDEIEIDGGTILQTFFPAPMLQPGQQIYTFPPSLKVVLKIGPGRIDSCTPSPTTLTRTTLLSPRMKRTLSRLKQDLDAKPAALPPLITLTKKFKHPLVYSFHNVREQEKFDSCEEKVTRQAFKKWCAEKGDLIVEQQGKTRVAACLSHIIRFWREQVLEEEEAAEEHLSESFLEYTMRRLCDMDEVECEVEEEERMYEEAAWEAQLAEPVGLRFLGA